MNLHTFEVLHFQIIAMDDPRRVAEQQRRKAGLFCQLGITRTHLPHPSIGGATGYTVAMRENQSWLHQNGSNQVFIAVNSEVE